jgi:PHP family Zn ribbon phosphoesterase
MTPSRGLVGPGGHNGGVQPQQSESEAVTALDAALAMPGGAKWRRAALQVNPYAYHQANGRQPFATSQEQYDTELTAALVAEGVDVVGITDHWRVRDSQSLRQHLVEAGVTVFPGFEATSSEGVHVLVLFDPVCIIDEVERRIHECGVDATTGRSGTCTSSLGDLLGRVRQWGAVAVPAHVATRGGLLEVMKGEPRIKAWTSIDLHAVALSGAVSDNLRKIVEGKDPQYRRDHPLALLNACDINEPADVGKPYATSWLKLSSPTAAGLDTAFRASATRVSTHDPAEHVGQRLTAVAWEGGFLNGLGIRLNDGLNVLIGGRGSGKSTVLESVRFALGLQPVTTRAQEQHAGVVTTVLGTAAKVTLLAECPSPVKRRLRIERTVGTAPRVFDDHTGEALVAPPTEFLPGVEVYGQRELADVADDKARQTAVLERLLPTTGEDSIATLQRQLADNRARLLSVAHEAERVDEQLARLAVVEEKLTAYADTGAPAALAVQRVNQREAGLLTTAEQRVGDAATGVEALRDAAAVDVAFLSPAVRQDLPHAALLAEADRTLSALAAGLQGLADQAQSLVTAAQSQLAEVRQQWTQATAADEARLDEVLRALRIAGVDAGDYLPLLAERERLQTVHDVPQNLAEQRGQLLDERRRLLDELEEQVSERTRALDRVGRTAERQLRLLRVSVHQQLDVERLVTLAREQVGGRLDKVEEALRGRADVTGRALSDMARQGTAVLTEQLGVPEGQARRLVAAGEHLFLRLEEVVATPVPVIELDIAEDGPPVWRPLEALSTGQKATALLLLLFVSGSGPLLVDQPEDDLDNRFVSEGIVPRLRDGKTQRQFLLSSHNANIPVLADADLIAALATERDGSRLRAVLPAEHVGSLDDEPVRELVEELLEGGKAAFETRRYRYGF